MDKALLRPLVFDALRRTPQTHLHAIENEIRQRSSGYERGDALLVQEVVWELLGQGVLAPGKNSLNLHLPFVHVTEYGQRCLEEGTIVAHDPDGYVARLRAETREAIALDVLESAQEALLAFHRGLFRASLVLLSRAAFEVLIELRDALEGDGDATSAHRHRDVASPAGLVCSVRGAASQRTLPRALTDEMEWRLSELEAVARLAHTEAGGPRALTADRESTLGRLLLFPAQCRFAYTLLEECRGARRESDS
jgi:hypothetical protein